MSKNKKVQSLKSGKISYNSTKSAQTQPATTARGEGAPEPASTARRRSPRASSAKRSSQTQPTSIAASHEVFPRHPGALTEGGHPRPAIHPNPEVEPRGHPWSDSNSFFGRSSAQEARRRNPDVIRDVHRPAGFNNFQPPDCGASSQRWRPRHTSSS